MLTQLAKNIEMEVQKDADGKVPVFVDPATITLVITAIAEIVKIIRACRKTDEEVVQTIHTASYADRRVVKRVLRRRLGWFKYWREGDKYEDAIVKQGKNIGVGDLPALYSEADSS